MYPSSISCVRNAAPIALATAILALPGCSIANLIGIEAATKRSEFTVPIPTSNQCQIRSENGSIHCVAAAVSEIGVEAVLTARAATVEQAESGLEQITVERSESEGVAVISARIPRGVRGGVSFILTVPIEMSLDLTTTNGAIDVTGVSGNVTAVTSNGEARVIDCDGDLDVRTSNGKITIEGELLADVKARTSNGTVRLKGSLLPGAHEIQTSNGSIHADLFGVPVTVTATTSNGQVTADGHKIKHGQAVTLGIPDSSGDSLEAAMAKLSLRTSNGSIQVSHGEANQASQIETN